MAYRLRHLRLFALDVHSKWLGVPLDKGLALTLNEWPNIEVLIIKRGLITEELFSRIQQNCKRLKVISIEFYDSIPYNHRLTEITDRVVDSLVELSELVKLRLHFTGLTDDGAIRLIENCPNLKYLDLFGCLRISSKTLKAISARLNRLNRCSAIFRNGGGVRNWKKSELHAASGHSLSGQPVAGKTMSRKLVKDKVMNDTTLNEKVVSERKENQSKWNKSRKLIDSPEQQSLDSLEEDYSSYSCKQFDTMSANCIECGKAPATFYVSINRTRIDLKKESIRLPNTLFLLSEDDPKWICYNYPPAL